MRRFGESEQGQDLPLYRKTFLGPVASGIITALRMLRQEDCKMVRLGRTRVSPELEPWGLWQS